MKLSIDVNETQERQLAEAAARLKVSPADLAAAALRDLLARGEEDF